jgi:hypothetical protein
MKMKINIPDELADKIALFPAVDFNKMEVDAFKKYVSKLTLW